ncbi:MAG: hypothetical protein M3071_07810 [Actinomycetota bacterium]|nr:hypothetical protein [Actinomycetota bacterium]
MPEEFVGRSAEQVDRIRAEQLAKRGTTRVITPKLSDEAKRLKAEQAELQRQFREALDREDEQRMAELSTKLEAKVKELSRADFPTSRAAGT